MASEATEIDCACHARRIAAVVCAHLLAKDGPPLGFVENNDDPKDLQGGCYACEQVFTEEGERSGRFVAFTQPTIGCDLCHAEIKARHVEGQ